MINDYFTERRVREDVCVFLNMLDSGILPKEELIKNIMGIKEFIGCIYFLYEDDDLVYIGRTVNPAQRIRNHMSNKQFSHARVFFIREIDLTGHNLLCQIERKCIKEQKPRLNIACINEKYK